MHCPSKDHTRIQYHVSILAVSSLNGITMFLLLTACQKNCLAHLVNTTILSPYMHPIILLDKWKTMLLNTSILLQFPYFIPFSLSILISTGGTPFLYLSFPSELSDTHAFLLLLAQPCAFSSRLSI